MNGKAVLRKSIVVVCFLLTPVVLLRPVVDERFEFGF